MDIRALVAVGLTHAELVSLTFDPSPETDPEERWVVSVGGEIVAFGETPEHALAEIVGMLGETRAEPAPLQIAA